MPRGKIRLKKDSSMLLIASSSE